VEVLAEVVACAGEEEEVWIEKKLVQIQLIDLVWWFGLQRDCGGHEGI
jgi:hypothetical protein